MSRAIIIVASLFLIYSCSVSANPGDLFTPVEYGVDVRPDVHEYLHSSHVFRHRFVSVNIQPLWNLFESARDLDSFEDVDSVTLRLFKDFVVETKIAHISHRYWYSYAMLVGRIPPEAGYADGKVLANIFLERDGRLSADIWAGGDIYYVSAVEKGPIHVITQVDPEKMPAMD